MAIISENTTKIKASLPKKDVHSKMEVFYNPIMRSNRNLSILLLNSIDNKNMNLALPLAGSGIRAIRFLNELKKGKMNHLFVNDKKGNFSKVLTKNLELNKLNPKDLSIFNEEASLFLLNQTTNKNKPNNFCGYFDYIDIDPFGTPNPFLNAAIGRICRKGILAVTATDTAALTGTYPQVTKRKYWAKTHKNYLMHELGLRILIRKVQLQGVQFDKALTPILAYHKDHYFRIYFKSENGKTKCDNLIKQHQFFLFNPKTLDFLPSKNNSKEGYDSIGPLWVGKLFDKKLVKKMAKSNPFPEEQKFLDILEIESKKDLLGFIDPHVIAKKYKLAIPKKELLKKKLKASSTIFSPTGLKTEKSIEDIVSLFK